MEQFRESKMARTGKLVLINGTNYDWRRTHCSAYQMQYYKFPELISSATCEICEIKWDKNAFISTWQCEGNVTYQLVSTDYLFNIVARINSGFDIYASYTNFSNLGNNFVKLAWVDEEHGYMQFYLSGMENRFVSTGSFAGANCWMYANLDILGKLTLNELCLAGSHDSGMSEINWRTTFANQNNCKTQTFQIYEQLMCGIRYFDLRIVIGSGQFHTGHYALVGRLEYEGARGQSLDSVIEQLNCFTACNSELIILSLSHCLNLDLGIHNRPFNQLEFNSLCFRLLDINHRFISSKESLNLIEKPLIHFIGNKHSAVLILLNDSTLEIDPKLYYHKGFYPSSEFPVFDKYTNTNRLDKMIKDQMNKMQLSRSSRSTNRSAVHLLSWTLTQQNIQTVGSIFGPSIAEMAFLANSNLFRLLSSDLIDLNIKIFVKKGIPNVILLDYVDSNVTAMCLAINLFNHKERAFELRRLRYLMCKYGRFLSFRYHFLFILTLVFNCLVYLYT